jgi:hypothetical protein
MFSLQLVERLVHMLNVDKASRTASKKALPETDEQKKRIDSVVADVNKLCKEVSCAKNLK